VDHPDGSNLWGATAVVRWRASRELTEALVDLSSREHWSMEELTMAAVVTACARWRADRRLLVDRVGHGRVGHLTDQDLSRTIGWFNVVYPVALELPADVECGALTPAAVRVLQQQLRETPNGGVGYSLLRYLAPEDVRRSLAALPAAALSCNYLGNMERLWFGSDSATPDERDRLSLSLAPENVLEFHRSERTRRRYLLNVIGSVRGNQLTLDWSYCRDVFEEPTITMVSDTSAAALLSLAAQSARPGDVA
jgi:non-ribosomal peptide synthase protein (TIGR01720 family)